MQIFAFIGRVVVGAVLGYFVGKALNKFYDRKLDQMYPAAS